MNFLKKEKQKMQNGAKVQELNSCVFRKRETKTEIVNMERELDVASFSSFTGFIKVGNHNELKSDKAKKSIHPSCLIVL